MNGGYFYRGRHRAKEELARCPVCRRPLFADEVLCSDCAKAETHYVKPT